MKAFVDNGIELAQVHALPPGSYIREDGVIKRHFEYKTLKPSNYDAEHTKLVIMNSVKKRMMADVKVGSFLSGGIDSSIVTAIAAYYQPDIEAFTIGIKGKINKSLISLEFA